MLGGLLVILPLALILILLLRAIAMVRKALEPIVSIFPEPVIFPELTALFIVVAACFLTGLIFRTRIGELIYQASERHILVRIPGYTLLRSLSQQITGEGEGVTFTAALVEIEEALVPAFLVEEHEDGSFTVFVPASPTPTVGAIYILPRERVHPVNVPFAKAVKCLSQWGVGSGELLQAMRRGK
jgi:uncharacterized membrane protein